MRVLDGLCVGAWQRAETIRLGAGGSAGPGRRVKSADPFIEGAPFFVGITGSDLDTAEEPVRSALDSAFDLLDYYLPQTPKIVLTSLATASDIVAASAAISRDGWRVVAPLPFRRDLYEADFNEASDLAAFRQLAGHPRVEIIELAPLRRRGSDKPLRDAELHRTSSCGVDHALHYEQTGLYIAERSGLLIGITGEDERPGRIGDAGRILEVRLNGDDATALDVRARSVELLHGAGLADPRRGAIWRIVLDPLRVGAGLPLTLKVQVPGSVELEAAQHKRAVRKSLELGTRLNDFNRRAATLGPRSTWALARDRLDRMAALRQMLSEIQKVMKARVLWSVWAIAALFVAAVLSVAVGGTFGDAWRQRLSVVYLSCVVGAVGIYIVAGVRQWQPLSEDYRAMSEALRAQIVLWQSDLTRPSARVDVHYLRGKTGSLGAVRDMVGQLVEGGRLGAEAQTKRPAAVEEWVESQFNYFSRMMTKRRKSVGSARTVSWFLLFVGIVLSAEVALLQVKSFEDTISRLATSPAESGDITARVATAVVLTLGCLFVSRIARARAAEPKSSFPPNLLRVGRVAVLAVSVLLAFALVNWLALLSGVTRAGTGPGTSIAQIQGLLGFAAAVATTVAGATRFVADKFSWRAELEGYEHGLDLFDRARRSLSALARATSTSPAQRKALTLQLVEEALRENEAWLLSHRERPLEPLLGG